MPPELSEITDQLTLTPAQYVGIPIALFGAILISLGTQLQHTGVSIVGARAVSGTKAGLGVRQLLALFALRVPFIVVLIVAAVTAALLRLWAGMP